MNRSSNSAPGMFGSTVPIPMQSSEAQQYIHSGLSGEVGENGQSFTPSTPQVGVLSTVEELLVGQSVALMRKPIVLVITKCVVSECHRPGYTVLVKKTSRWFTIDCAETF